MKSIQIIFFTAIASSLCFASPGDAIARVDGKKINPDYLDAVVEKINPNMEYKKLSAEQKKAVLDGAIEKKLFAIEAKKEGLINGSKYEKVVEALSDDYASSLLVKRELEKITVSQEELKQAFEKIKPIMPIQLHLRQIVVADKQAAQATLERLIKTEQSKLLEVFEQEAKNSIDTEGAKKGGDLGWLGMDRIVEPFAGQLAMLKNGELSQSIVRGPNGWHIILLQERSPERAATIEEARAKLEAAIKYEKLKSIMAEKKEQLMKKYKVEMVK